MDFISLMLYILNIWIITEACGARGHKWHMPLMNQIRGAYALSKYAHDEIRKSMFLPPMKMSHKQKKKHNSIFKFLVLGIQTNN